MIFPRRRQAPHEDEDLASREDPYNEAQASRIYILPNLMTAGNLLCGFMAVLNCIHARLAGHRRRRPVPRGHRGRALPLRGLLHLRCRHLRHAGRPAGQDGRPGVPLRRGVRLTGRRRLVRDRAGVPHVLPHPLARPRSSPGSGTSGAVVGFFYLLCAAMRLARFNVITNPLLHQGKKESNKDFIGLPVPAAAMTVASLVLFLLKLDDSDKSLNWFALGAALPDAPDRLPHDEHGPLPSGKKVDLQTQTRLRTFVAAPRPHRPRHASSRRSPSCASAWGTFSSG